VHDSSSLAASTTVRSSPCSVRFSPPSFNFPRPSAPHALKRCYRDAQSIGKGQWACLYANSSQGQNLRKGSSARGAFLLLSLTCLNLSLSSGISAQRQSCTSPPLTRASTQDRGRQLALPSSSLFVFTRFANTILGESRYRRTLQSDQIQLN